MKVLKFGGTSVGTPESLQEVKNIVSHKNDEKIIVVVSALGGVTDTLIQIARMAVDGDTQYLSKFEELSLRHISMVDALLDGDKKQLAHKAIDKLLGELSNIYRGLSLIHDMSDRTLDTIVSYGERLSSTIISYYLDASLFDARDFIHTKNQWGKHIYDKENSNPEILKTFEKFLESHVRIALVPGFISSDSKTGMTTNLGRGGSDYTAAILAASLGASILEIWTDVDGFMTADPRVISTAYAIDRLSFTEAMELCNFGAKVIYPPTIYPVYLANIPILIKNTFNPEAKGTLIASFDEEHIQFEDKLIKGISSISDTSLISISGPGMVGILGINARIFISLASNGISVFMVSQASSENSTSLGVRDSDAKRASEVLHNEFATEIQNGSISDIKITSGLSTVAVVGANMRKVPGVAGKLFNTLGRNGIRMIACAQGANQTNISFVVNTNELRKTLNVIHDSFFLSPTQILNLFIIGTGNVGKSLINQIYSQQAELLKKKSLEIKVVGIANSRKSLFDRNGLDLSDISRLLDEKGERRLPEEIYAEVLKMNIFNPVFVDCTSNPNIAELYENLLLHNVNVVAANKISASGPYDNYLRLKMIARQRDVKFLFETNVGAGLPIISTLNSLINSGDRILKIEAVLSGTLNYIFNILSDDIGLGKAVEMARLKGYTESDPRIDLSGDDVVRKIVILARESGYRVEKDDVEKQLFVPQEYFNGNIDTFLNALKTFEKEFENKRKEVEKRGARYRFVATYENGHASIGLKEIPPQHPFYNIEGSNNVIALTTERYKEFPIVIKGYGAGAEVTAAGVFADIISIANIR